MNSQALEALDRLIAIAMSDTGQSGRVADFILAWWNTSTMGGWNPVDIGTLDRSICTDILTILSTLEHGVSYPYERRAEIEELQRMWRADVLARPTA